MCNKATKSIKYNLITLLFLFFPVICYKTMHATIGDICEASDLLALPIISLILAILVLLVEVALNFVPGIKDNEALANLKPIASLAALLPAIMELVTLFVALGEAGKGFGINFAGVIYMIILFAWMGHVLIKFLRGIGVDIPSISGTLNNK